jgi:hypothetical protein
MVNISCKLEMKNGKGWKREVGSCLPAAGREAGRRKRTEVTNRNCAKDFPPGG